MPKKPQITRHNIRKLGRSGQDSYAITLPIDLVRELRWREGQKLVVTRDGEGLRIVDWEEK
jgi:bifunctional DNA-binding transcriptional regulator/antitoxin component of YhaV-PrlF toxin-antitoxin module